MIFVTVQYPHSYKPVFYYGQCSKCADLLNSHNFFMTAAQLWLL